MELVAQVQILDEAICVSLLANALGKDINPSVLLLAIAKWLGRLGSLALVMQAVKEKENSEFNSAVLHLKNDLVSHPAYSKGIG